jgi:TolB protein
MKRLLVCAALAALLVAGCGGSSGPPGPPALVFVSVRDADYALFGADADGKHVRRLSEDRGDPSTPAGLFWQLAPAWSPDGTEIAFASARDGTTHIYVMRADGTGTRRLTNTDQNDDHPTWSPDGKWIAFAREGALFRIPADGGPAARLGREPGSASAPAYSPDGDLIAYDYRRPGFSIRELYVMNADGTRVRQATDLRDVSTWPAWSPDGRTLAFQSNALGNHAEIYTVPAGGGRAKRITATGTDAIQPAWSPDGTRLTFSRGGAIWVTQAGKETRLTSGDGNDSSPAWRPPTRE